MEQTKTMIKIALKSLTPVIQRDLLVVNSATTGVMKLS